MNKKSPKKKKVETKKSPLPDELNPQRMRFCKLYTQNSNLFGNATLCYAEAFGFDLESLSQEAVYGEPDEFGKREKLEDSEYTKAYNTCSVNGSGLLRITKIDEYIKVLLNEMMTNENADAELAWVMKQRQDLGPKIQALREFNKLKNRILNEVVVTTNIIDPSEKEKRDSVLFNYIKNNGRRTTENS
jgi:hypothetical protein